MDLLPTDLLGVWELRRHVEDRLGPPRTVTGTAELVLLDEDRVGWAETGEMTWRTPGQTHTVPVTRTLVVVRRGPAWWVTFEDGRDFHPWTTAEAVHHPCGADDYAGRIRPEPDGWSVTWEVRGPRKDYTMHTTMTRPPRGQ